jgi:hypothetical protein
MAASVNVSRVSGRMVAGEEVHSASKGGGVGLCNHSHTGMDASKKAQRTRRVRTPFFQGPEWPHGRGGLQCAWMKGLDM